MKFVVNFKSKVRYAICLDVKYVGLAFLRRARKESYTPDLLAKRVHDFAFSLQYNPTIEITEEEAEGTGHYDDTTHIDVTVPFLSLNRYVVLRTDIDRNPKTGETTSVKPVWVLDKDRLKAAWFSSGAPLGWDPEEN